MIPRLGGVVLYTLTDTDASAINRRRTDGSTIAVGMKAGVWPLGAQAHIGSEVSQGDVFPLIVTRVWPAATSGGSVNGQVVLDGTDCLWVTSVVEAPYLDHEPLPVPGRWHVQPGT